MVRPRAEKRGRAITVYLTAEQIERLSLVDAHMPAAIRKTIDGSLANCKPTKTKRAKT